MGQQQQNSSSSSQPWSAQEPYLTSAFNSASNDYTNMMNQGPYSGNYIAPTNPMQYDAATNEYNTASGPLTSANNSLVAGGVSNANTGFSNTDSALSALNNLIGSNNAGNLTSTANQIASGYNVPAEVAAAMQTATDTAANSTLPNLYRGAAVSGNLNSDRTAVAQGQVDQGLAETAANLAGSLENQNYTTGLNTASNLNNQNLSALSSLGSLGLGLGNSGTSAITTGVNNAGNIATQAQTGANEVQNLDQSNLNNTIDQYNANQQFPWTSLQNYYNIIGNKSWGTTSNSQTTSDPSVLSMIGGGLGVLGSLF